MTLQEFYAQIGGNYADTVRRLCNESLVLRFVKKYPANPSMDELRAAIGQQDWETAFRAVHTLKGIAQNLGFSDLAAAAHRLTEGLRDASGMPQKELVERVDACYEGLMGAIGELE